MDGLAAISARVQQIQGLVQGMQTPVRTPATPGSAAGPPLTSTSTTGAAPGSAGQGGGATTRTASSSAVAFDAALGRATAATAAGTSAAASGGGARAAAAGRLDADGVPVDLKRYGNGKIPSDAMTGIGVGNHRLWGPAAESFRDLVAAAKRAGVTIGVTDSYRSYEAQVDVARRKGLYKDGGLAAVPGTSDHGWGLSVDLDLSTKAQAWMRQNADRFGFDENTPREPWHWTFIPKG